MEALLWPERAGDPEAEATRLLPGVDYLSGRWLCLFLLGQVQVSPSFPRGFHSAFNQKCSECLPETYASGGGYLILPRSSVGQH